MEARTDRGRARLPQAVFASPHVHLGVIAAGIATFEIARMAGTSVLQIEKTYGHLLPDAIERGRGALDSFDARSATSRKETAR